MKELYGKKILGKSYKQTVIEIIDTTYNPSKLLDMKQNEAIVFLAEQVDTLWQIIKAYKTGKL